MIAAELMTEDPTTIRQTDPVSDALVVLQSLEIRHLPVVDDDNNLVGMLTDRDLGPLMRLSTEGIADAEKMVLPLSLRPVGDFMSSDVVSVDADTDMIAIIDTLLEEHIGAVPVVDGEGSVIGIVTYVDILRAVGREGELEPSRPRKAPASRDATPSQR